MIRFVYYLSLGILLSGCTAPEILDPRPSLVPVSINLSGKWLLRNNRQAAEERIQKAIRRTEGPQDKDLFPSSEPEMRERSSRRGPRTEGGLVYVFLETGSLLKITQTEHGLFISFDRAVVEEFRFGEDRLINVGEVEAQRVTGWEKEQLVVETLDRNSMKLTERFQLLGGGTVLQRIISFRSRAGETESFTQLFDKTP